MPRTALTPTITKYTWKIFIFSVMISLFVTGLMALILYAAGVRNEHEEQYDYGVTEAYRQNIPPTNVIHFPFGYSRINRNITTSTTQKSIQKCSNGFFMCNITKACLELSKRCDGSVDCPNAEDERNCVCAFRMPPAKFCDKYPDCFDASDESYCNYCPPESFNCGNGECIPRNNVCDLKLDCANAMDENFCFRLTSGFSSTKETLKSGFLLRNQNGAWYPLCVNPYDTTQDVLASQACVSITANPLVGSTYEQRLLLERSRHYIYHNYGRFIGWNRCITQEGLFITCDDVLCGFNPELLLPRPRQGRIVGGDLSEPGAWPWHAAVYKNGSYACGASLINDRWLLSAAHCFVNFNTNYYEIQLGTLRRRSFTPHQRTYRIDKIILHKQFSMVTLEYDIAMLRTADTVTFNYWIRPICLPSPNEVETAGSYCTVIGWGDTGETEEDSDDLQEVHVPLTTTCKRSGRWLCAGFPEGGRDACQGDSGGPLMCQKRDGISWYIAGIISAGTGCARPRNPGMYTRVSFYLDWITSTMANLPLSQNSPLLSCPGWTCSAVGGGHCLHPEKLCDGHVDCYEASDEVNCKNGGKIRF